MRYMALDFETGNASPLSACALGISVYEDKECILREANLIRPPDEVGDFHWGNVKVNRIHRSMVKNSPSFADVWQKYASLAEQSVIVCHNAVFDTAVLCKCLTYYGLAVPHCRYLCTVKVSQRVWPELENHKLDTVSRALAISLNHHEAGSDAEAAGQILLAALQQTGCRDAAELAQKIGMTLGTISPQGRTPCSIAQEKNSSGSKRCVEKPILKRSVLL